MKRLTIPALAILALATVVRADVVFFDLQGKAGFGLLAGNENTVINGTPGSGGEINTGFAFDTTTKILTLNFSWSGLQGASVGTLGAATGFHIHGPTTGVDPFLSSVGVLHNISGGTAGGGAIPSYTVVNNAGGFGSVTGTISSIPASQEADLFAGKWYVNVHSGVNAGGEIRGNLVVVPEPGSLSLLGLGAVALLARRNRKAD